MEQWSEHTGLSATYHFPLYKYRPQDKMKAAISHVLISRVSINELNPSELSLCYITWDTFILHIDQFVQDRRNSSGH